MDGLSFVAANLPVKSDPARADIACFIGWIGLRGGDSLVAERRRLEGVLESLGWAGPNLPEGERLLPPDVRGNDGPARRFAAWLQGRGWHPLTLAESNRAPVSAAELFREVLGRWFSVELVEWWTNQGFLDPASGVGAGDFLELINVPLLVETWDEFDGLFDWNNRAIGAVDRCDTTLGVAVRSYFGNGGRKCYVVRLGDPWAVLANPGGGSARFADYLPTFPEVSIVDRASWRGVGHLLALPDVSFLCLPDLPELFVVPVTDRVNIPLPTTPEVFVECGTAEETVTDQFLQGVAAPRCDATGFERWADAVRRVGEFLRRCVREVQFIASIPLPVGDNAAHEAGLAQWTQTAAIRTAFVQLTYPWLHTRNSAVMPGGLQPADGVLAGLLAGSALTRGSWRSAMRLPVPEVSAVEPILDRATLERDLSPLGTRRTPLTLRERVSVFGPSPGGIQLLSDVTMAEDDSYRPANVNRLVMALIRAARLTSEPSVFQNNGEELWSQLRDSLGDLLAGLWAEGALAGDTADDAYEVRCDRSTMTQADLDAGRVICTVTFTAAAPIVHLTVVLAMDEGGHLTPASRQVLVPSQTQAA